MPFQSEDLVWAPFNKFRAWPGKIMVKDIKKNKNKDTKNKTIKNKVKSGRPTRKYVVYFFGYHKHDRVPVNEVHKYIDHVHEFSKGSGRKNRLFQAALNYIHEQHWCLVELKREDPSISGYKLNLADKKELQEEAIKAGRSVKPKKGRKRALQHFSSQETDVTEKRLKSDENTINDFSQFVPFTNDDSNLPSFTEDGDGLLSIEQGVDNETMPFFNVRAYDCTVVSSFPRHVRAKCKTCNVKFGFIGLGKSNQIIIEQILTKRHIVNVWTKISYKYEKFMKIGANRKHTPEELITSSDVIFCTMPDIDVSIHFRYAKAGIYDGLSKSDSPKTYVSITNLDQSPDEDIQKVVLKFGISYFEIKLIVPSENGENCLPIILCAGNQKVFTEMKTYFKHVSSHVHYFGSKFGEKPVIDIIPFCIAQTVQKCTIHQALKIFQKIGYEVYDESSIRKAIGTCDAATCAMENI